MSLDLLGQVALQVAIEVWIGLGLVLQRKEDVASLAYVEVGRGIGRVAFAVDHGGALNRLLVWSTYLRVPATTHRSGIIFGFKLEAHLKHHIFLICNELGVTPSALTLTTVVLLDWLPDAFSHVSKPVGNLSLLEARLSSQELF